MADEEQGTALIDAAIAQYNGEREGVAKLVGCAIVSHPVRPGVPDGAHRDRPVVDGRPTHPVVLSAALFADLEKERGDVGGRSLLERLGDDLLLVPAEDGRLLLDVDSPADYEKVRSLHDRAV